MTCFSSPGHNFISVDWPGRMANQIMAWAGARHQFSGRPITIAINCPQIRGRVRLPQCLNAVMDTSSWNRFLLEDWTGDCGVNSVWVDSWHYRATGSLLSLMVKDIDWGEVESEASELIASAGAPVFGIHYRCGDYLTINHDEPPDPIPDFVRSPASYYLGHIQNIAMNHTNAKFFLATDGNEDDCRRIDRQGNMLRGKSDDPVFDLLALSKCCRIIGSDSTFSHLAGAIGNISVTYPSTYQHDPPKAVDQMKQPA